MPPSPIPSRTAHSQAASGRATTPRKPTSPNMATVAICPRRVPTRSAAHGHEDADRQPDEVEDRDRASRPTSRSSRARCRRRAATRSSRSRAATGSRTRARDPRRAGSARAAPGHRPGHRVRSAHRAGGGRASRRAIRSRRARRRPSPPASRRAPAPAGRPRRPRPASRRRSRRRRRPSPAPAASRLVPSRRSTSVRRRCPSPGRGRGCWRRRRAGRPGRPGATRTRRCRRRRRPASGAAPNRAAMTGPSGAKRPMHRTGIVVRRPTTACDTPSSAWIWGRSGPSPTSCGRSARDQEQGGQDGQRRERSGCRR